MLRRYDIVAENTHQTPSHPPAAKASLESHVAVPFFEALGVGLLLALTAAALIIINGSSPLLVKLKIAFATFFILFTSTTTGAYLFLLRFHLRLLLPPQPPPPAPAPEPPEPATVTVELHSGNSTRFIDLNVDPQRLALFAKAILSGAHGLSEAEWTGRGRPFTRSEYKELRARLLAAGLIRYRSRKDPARGFELTPAGRATFQRLIEEIG